MNYMPPLSLNDHPNGDVLHLPVEGSLQSSVIPHPSFHRPIIGVSHNDAFRFLPQDRINGGEHVPVPYALPPVSWFMTPAQIASATPTGGYSQASYQNLDFGVHGRKTNRATRVCYTSRRYNYYGALLTNS